MEVKVCWNELPLMLDVDYVPNDDMTINHAKTRTDFDLWEHLSGDAKDALYDECYNVLEMYDQNPMLDRENMGDWATEEENQINHELMRAQDKGIE